MKREQDGLNTGEGGGRKKVTVEKLDGNGRKMECCK